MYCYIIRIRYAIKDGNQSSHVDIVHHLSHPCKLVYVELRETMAPEPYQIHEHTFIVGFHQEYHTLILKQNIAISEDKSTSFGE